MKIIRIEESLWGINVHIRVCNYLDFVENNIKHICTYIHAKSDLNYIDSTDFVIFQPLNINNFSNNIIYS